MSKPVVLVTSTTVSEQARKPLRDAGFEIVFMTPPVTEESLASAFSRRRIEAVLLRGPAPFTPAVFAGARHLKIISKHGAGVDSVDIEAATGHGVAVMITNGVNAAAVAEHALALMLCMTRELPQFDRRLRTGAWKDPAYTVRDFGARTVGIVGYGQIGRTTARLANACGAKVIVHSRTRAGIPQGMEWEESLDRLVGRVDILSLHCPLTDATRGMIGAKQLQLMKPGAIIVNTGRGKLIDESALVAALKSGRIAGAGLDTFATEPPDPANPLLALPNVILTPHVASSTSGAAALMGSIAANNIISYLRGEIYDPQNFLNPAVFRKP